MKYFCAANFNYDERNGQMSHKEYMKVAKVIKNLEEIKEMCFVA